VGLSASGAWRLRGPEADGLRGPGGSSFYDPVVSAESGALLSAKR